MYTSFFGLGEKPFAITPDPRYLFMSERHAEALAHLLYGITEAGGFIQLTGEVGTGKTTIVRSLLERMPGHADVAVILNPQLTPVEFVLTICEELGIFMRDEDTASIKDLVDLLNRRLLEAHARGRRVVVMVDEAQTLSPATLEQVRLLTNLETGSQKLLQIILIGQPELREALDRVELRQLAQRITGRYHLAPLSRSETAAYVNHRMKVAGATVEVFTGAALREVHRLSGGVPRIINVICDRALLGAFTQEQHHIGAGMIREAASEVYGRSFNPPWMKALVGSAGGVAAFGLGLSIWQLWPSQPAESEPLASLTPPALEAPAPAPAEIIPVSMPPDLPAAPRAQDAAEVLIEKPGLTNTETAFGQLFALWGANFNPRGGRPCDQAKKQGLQCVYQTGSWAQLRTLNRPAILTLLDDEGNAHQVVVSGLINDTARLNLPDETKIVTLPSLSRLWSGDYLVMWRPQLTASKPLVPGMRGDGVRWLRQQLHTARGESSTAAESDVYDEDLVKMVEEFQRQNRLNVDGIAGVQTQIVLDSVGNATGSPQLIARTGSSQGAS
jgi:general secretion pathway protein A